MRSSIKTLVRPLLSRQSVDAAPTAVPASPGASGGAMAKATPLARRLAEQAGIDLSTVTGTGARG